MAITGEQKTTIFARIEEGEKISKVLEDMGIEQSELKPYRMAVRLSKRLAHLNTRVRAVKQQMDMLKNQ